MSAHQISQGSISSGAIAQNEIDRALFVEVFYVREAILAAPEGMSESETRSYFGDVSQHMKNVSMSALSSAQPIPYLLGAFGYVHLSRKYRKEHYLRALELNPVWSTYVTNTGETRLFNTDDFVCPIPCEDWDLFWVQSIHEINSARRARSLPLLRPCTRVLGYQRFAAVVSHPAYRAFEVLDANSNHVSAVDEAPAQFMQSDPGAHQPPISGVKRQRSSTSSSRGDSSLRHPDSAADRTAGYTTHTAEVQQATRPPSEEHSTPSILEGGMSQVASRPKPKPKKRRVEADGSYEEPVKSSKAKGKEREVPFGRTREVIPAPEYGPEKWDENADEPPPAFARQIWVIPRLLEVTMSPIPCQQCISSGLPCYVKMGTFHGCIFCKISHKGCDLCPKAFVYDSKTNRNSWRIIPKSRWCRFITGIHLALSFVQMNEPEGPRGTLPDYTGVTWTTFPPSAATPTKTQNLEIITQEWNRMQDQPNFISGYKGVPYQKMMVETALRNPRPRWPKIPVNIAQILGAMFEAIDQNGLNRPWAIGYRETVFKFPSQKVKEEKIDQPITKRSMSADTYGVDKSAERQTKAITRGRTREPSTKPGPGHSGSRRPATRSTTRSRTRQPESPRPTKVPTRVRRAYVGRQLKGFVKRAVLTHAPSETEDDEIRMSDLQQMQPGNGADVFLQRDEQMDASPVPGPSSSRPTQTTNSDHIFATRPTRREPATTTDTDSHVAEMLQVLNTRVTGIERRLDTILELLQTTNSSSQQGLQNLVNFFQPTRVGPNRAVSRFEEFTSHIMGGSVAMTVLGLLRPALRTEALGSFADLNEERYNMTRGNGINVTVGGGPETTTRGAFINEEDSGPDLAPSGPQAKHVGRSVESQRQIGVPYQPMAAAVVPHFAKAGQASVPEHPSTGSRTADIPMEVDIAPSRMEVDTAPSRIAKPIFIEEEETDTKSYDAIFLALDRDDNDIASNDDGSHSN